MASEQLGKADNLYEPRSLKAESFSASDDLLIPIIEEKATISKETFELGRVKIIKKVDVIEEIVSTELTEEEIFIERKPINEQVAEIPSARQEGNTTIYPVLKEIVVMEKRLVLIEEIHVTKRNKVRTAEETISLRRETIDVQRESIENERPGEINPSL